MFDILSQIFVSRATAISISTHRFSLSDDAAIETILTEIPLFGVGLMGFGVFTFFLIQKQFNLSATYLFLSSAFAFGAAIFDLSQVLERGVDEMNDGTGVQSVSVLLNTREVFLAISTGLRFVFMWEFVSTRPRWDPVPRPHNSLQALINQPLDMLHSASWDRWGLTGYVLKWSTLGMSIAIPVLQIVWRITAEDANAVYVSDGTLEITAASIFILKLLLNTAFAPPSKTGSAFMWYLVPLSVFFLFMAIGVMNLIYFAFTETLLGRFLVAIGMYTLILYILVFVFYDCSPRSRPGSVASSRRSNRDTELWGSSSEKTPNPVVRQPSVIPYIPPPAPPRPSRNSAVSRLASWISPRRPSRPQSLYSHNSTSALRHFEMDPERDGSPSTASESKLSDTVEVLSPRVSELKRDGQGQWGGSQYTSGSAAPSPSTADSHGRMPTGPEASGVVVFPAISEKGSSEENVRSSPEQSRSSPDSSSRMARPGTEISLGSYYTPYTNSAAPSSFLMPQMPAARPRTPDSPIYGLEGLIDPRDRRVIPFTPQTVASSTAEPMASRDFRGMPSPDFSLQSSSQRGSGTSIDELLRQQSELDKSIAALRLFSPRSSAATMSRYTPPESGTVDPMPSVPPSERASTVVKITPSRGTSSSEMSGKMTAASGQSEFSLSVFPAPPASAAVSPMPGGLSPFPGGVSPAPGSVSPARSNMSPAPWAASPMYDGVSPTRGRTEDFPQSVTLQPPKPGESALSSPATPSSRGGRIQSNGTQYDVTSFIVPRSFEASGHLAGLASPMTLQPLPNTPITPQQLPASPVTPQRLPNSPLTPLPTPGRMRSEVTQYDVTSFIGDLTSPEKGATASSFRKTGQRAITPPFPVSVGGSRPSTSEGEDVVLTESPLPIDQTPSEERPQSPSDDRSSEAEASSSGVTPSPVAPVLRPLRLTSGGPPVTHAAPTEPRPSRHVRISSVTKDVPPLRPLLLGTGPGLPPRSAIKPTLHNRSNSYGMPPGPRRQGSNTSLRPAKALVISIPRPLPQDGELEDDSGAYERPRAAPPVFSQED